MGKGHRFTLVNAHYNTHAKGTGYCQEFAKPVAPRKSACFSVCAPENHRFNSTVTVCTKMCTEREPYCGSGQLCTETDDASAAVECRLTKTVICQKGQGGATTVCTQTKLATAWKNDKQLQLEGDMGVCANAVSLM